MSVTERNLEVSNPSADLEFQALLITVPNEYTDTFPPQATYTRI